MPASVTAFGFGFDFFLGNMKQYGVRLPARRLFRQADLLKVVAPNGIPIHIALLTWSWKLESGQQMTMQTCSRTLAPK